MGFENKYIKMVEDSPYIISETEKLSQNKGKWLDFFKNKNEIFLEIGTGFGEFFALESSKNLDKNFIGMEIKFKRLIKTQEKTLKGGNKNFVLIKEFAQKITDIFAENEISKTYIFFPDPWDKKDRQKKHKLFQTKFIRDLAVITKKGGKVIFKTDHLKYFKETLELFEENNDIWEKGVCSFDYENEFSGFDTKNITVFESIYRGNDVKINYVEFIKK